MIYPVDSQAIQQLLDSINRAFATDLPDRKRRVIGEEENTLIKFVESNGIDWMPGVVIYLDEIRPLNQEDIIWSTTMSFFRQRWS
jgi:hypothetical protein